MADNKVKFLRGTSNEYAVAEKDDDAIYFTTDDGKLYIGNKEISGDGSLTIDDKLSNTSTNPVQNKVINSALAGKAASSHNQPSSTITAMTGYSKASSASAIAAGDSLNTAIGKLEKALDSKQPSGSYAAASHKHDDRYYTESEVDTKLSGKLNTSLKGTANGLAELDPSGKVPSIQLPSYVDDVLEYTNKASFPATGESGKIYIAQDNNKTYRWSGSAYVEISPSLALGETSATAYRGDRGKIAYEHSQKAHAPSNAEANQNAFSNVIVGSTTIAADSKTDTLTLAAGNNITITPDANNDKITIASTWRGIQNNLTSDSTTDSLSAAQGKALKALVDGKAASSHTHTKSQITDFPTSIKNPNALNINGVSYDGSAAKDIDLLPFIVGTQTAVTGSWTGNASSISALFDGLTIRYWLPYAGSGNATLNLTLANGSTTGAVNCYYNGTARLTTHYAAGNIITLTYRSNVSIAGSSTKYTGWWADANYDSGNTKNTTGSTNTSSKIFLIGATSQANSPVTYSHDTAYVGTDGCLYSNSTKVSVEGHTHSSYVNQNAFSNIKVGNTTIAADTATDALTLEGKNITLTPDVTNDKVTIEIKKENVTSALGYTPPKENTTYSSKAAVSGGTDVSLVTTGEKYNWNAKASTAVFVKSGSGAKAGLVPAPPTTAGTTKYLREDGTWVVPPKRDVVDNLTSTDTTKSLSANQGKVLKGLVDGKAAASHSHNYAGSSSAGGAATTALKCTGNSATATKLTSSSCTTITIDTSNWTTNSDGGYMCTKTLSSAMPYENFNFDVVLSTDQSAAKLQIAAWNCIIADGEITQNTSNGSTTVFTFYSFTAQPSVSLTVAIQGVS